MSKVEQDCLPLVSFHLSEFVGCNSHRYASLMPSSPASLSTLECAVSIPSSSSVLLNSCSSSRYFNCLFSGAGETGQNYPHLQARLCGGVSVIGVESIAVIPKPE